MGLRSFGSQHIIDALHARGDIDDERKTGLRKSLHSLGTMGIFPTSQELIEQCAEAAYSLSTSLAVTLWDPLLLRGESGYGLVSLVDMLASIYEDSPGRLNLWVMRIIDLLETQIESFSVHQAGAHLVVAAFSHTLREEGDGAFLTALIGATSWAVSRLDFWGDGPLDAAKAAANGGEVLAQMLGRHEHPLIAGAMLARFVDLLGLSIRHQCRIALMPLYIQISQVLKRIETLHKQEGNG
jgi:hypothetical protein